MIEEKRKHFIDNIYDPFYGKKILEAEEYFYNNRKTIKDRIVDSFQISLANLNKNADFDVSYIVCTLLKTNLLENKYICTVMAYDERFYISEGLKIGEIDFSDIYKYYNECDENGMKSFRRYVGALCEVDVKKISNDKLFEFNEIVEKALQYSLFEISSLDEYQDIRKSKEFSIIVGQYFEFTTIIHTENKEKEYLELKTKLMSKELDDLVLVSEDYREVTLENLMLDTKSLLVCDFNFSSLKNFIFELCILGGTRFTNAKLEKVVFNKCMMSEIDFRNAKIVNSIFREAVMYIEHDEVKYTEANFSNCYFEDVRFIDCVMYGVDFTYANIENVKIASTKFEQCIFSQNSREYLKSIDEEIITKNFFV